MRLALVLLVVVVCSWGALDNGFVWDDAPLILQGDFIHDPANLFEVWVHDAMYAVHGDEYGATHALDTYRPVTMSTFFWDAALSGRDPLSYHVTNLVAHLGCVALVFLLILQLVGPGAKDAAGLLALWFGLHPLLAEAHVWVNGRSDVFAALFGLAAVLLWLRARGPAGQLGAALLFLLGCLSKEVLVMGLPALALLALLGPPGSSVPDPGVAGRATERSVVAALLRIAPLAVAGALALGMRVVALSGMKASEGPGHLLTALAQLPWLLVDGLAFLLVPRRLAIRLLQEEYGELSTVQLVLAALLVLAGTAALLAARRRFPLGLWAWVWFGGILAPVALVSATSWWGFGRYLYVPAAGVAIALAAVLQAALSRAPRPRTRRLLLGGVTLYVATLGVLLVAATEDWQDQETLSRGVIRDSPDVSLGWLGLGTLYVERGDPAAALPLLQEATRRNPRSAAAAFNQGVVHQMLGQLPAARDELTRAVALEPGDHKALYNLGLVTLDLGDGDGALGLARTGQRRFAGRPDFFHLQAQILAPVDAVGSLAPTLQALGRAPGHPPSLALIEAILESHPQRAAYAAALRSALPGPALGAVQERLGAAAKATLAPPPDGAFPAK